MAGVGVLSGDGCLLGRTRRTMLGFPLRGGDRHLERIAQREDPMWECRIGKLRERSLRIVRWKL